MAYKIVNEDSLTAIADAIREKKETTDTYSLGAMPQAIASIEGGSQYEDGEVMRW